MWILSTSGFYSVVQKPEDVPADMLTVRGRVRSDLANMGLGKVISTPDADYRFRVRAPADAVAARIAGLCRSIDYVSFKDAVAQVQGNDRANLYALVWLNLARLQFRSTDLAFLDD